MAVVVNADPELLLVGKIRGYIATAAIPGLAAYSVGTLVKDGTTPAHFIQVRLTGGVEEQRVADRPLVDVRMWSTGAALDELDLKAAARTLVGFLRRDVRCSVFLSPTPFPDPADRSKTHVMFTLSLLIRGAQQ